MPLPTTPENAHGGILALAYIQTGLNIVHSIHLAVAHFDPTPSGPDNDYLYNGTGPVTPGERGLLSTFAAVAGQWAGYYDPTWQLQLIGAWYNTGEGDVPLPGVPVAAPVSGTAPTTPTMDPRVRRIFYLYSTRGVRWRVWLQKLPAGPVGEIIDVWPSGGGFDARDRALLAYLSSTATGVVGRDGQHFGPGASVRQWWDRPLFGATAGEPGAPYIVSG